MALCITNAEPELTARPWFRVLNSHQEYSAYPGFAVFISVAKHLVEAYESQIFLFRVYSLKTAFLKATYLTKEL